MQSRSVKCVVIGDGTVGKSSLLISYTQNRFPGDYIPTDVGIYAANIVVDGANVNLAMWDTAGQEDYDNLRARYCYDGVVDVFIVCFSIISRSSFDNIPTKWMSEIRRYYPGKPLVLVGTKLDLRENLEAVRELKQNNTSPISYQEGLALANRVGAVKYLECSAFTRQGLKRVFDDAARAAVRPRQVKKIKKHSSCILQ